MSEITLWGNRNNDIFDTMDAWTDRFFGPASMPRSLGPKTNVTKTDNGVEVSLAVPGVNKEDINVNIENNMMTVSYSASKKTEATFATKSFSKSWTLPENTDAEFITAKSENGILTLSVPTSDATIPTRTITVQ